MLIQTKTTLQKNCSTIYNLMLNPSMEDATNILKDADILPDAEERIKYVNIYKLNDATYYGYI